MLGIGVESVEEAAAEGRHPVLRDAVRWDLPGPLRRRVLVEEARKAVEEARKAEGARKTERKKSARAASLPRQRGWGPSPRMKTSSRACMVWPGSPRPIIMLVGGTPWSTYISGFGAKSTNGRILLKSTHSSLGGGAGRGAGGNLVGYGEQCGVRA